MFLPRLISALAAGFLSLLAWLLPLWESSRSSRPVESEVLADADAVGADPALAPYLEGLSRLSEEERARTVLYLRELYRLKAAGLGLGDEVRRTYEEYYRTAEPGLFRAGAALNLAMLALHRGEPDEAERYFRAVAVADGPQAERASVELAALLRRRGEEDAARRQLLRGPHHTRGTIRDAHDAREHRERAEEFSALGDRDSARLAFLEGTPDPAVDGAVRVYLHEGMMFTQGFLPTHPAEAANFQAGLLRKYPRHVDADGLATLSWAQRGAGQRENYEATQKALRELFPDSHWVAGLMLQDADAAQQEGRKKAAERIARDVLAHPAAADGSLKEGAGAILGELLGPPEPDGDRPDGPGDVPLVPRPDPLFDVPPDL